MKADYLKFEDEFLSPYAKKSKDSKGRLKENEPCPLRAEFQRDRDRILHSKSFRRLKHKTQVFLLPNGDHYRTRLTHTLEVTQIARTISRALMLNEDLTEAIALGHDLGHPPFGHAGERTLNQKTGHFYHNEQSLRVVDVLEDDGAGLNLTFEVRDGILNHRSECNPQTLEGMVVRISDKIAYLNHDLDDAIRAGILKEKDIPKDVIEILGHGKGKMINSLVNDIVVNSYNKDSIIQSKDYKEAMLRLREFMFSNVYIDSLAKKEEIKADRLLATLYDYFIENPDSVPKFYRNISNEPSVYISDYLSTMTDNFALTLFKDIYVPNSWNM